MIIGEGYIYRGEEGVQPPRAGAHGRGSAATRLEHRRGAAPCPYLPLTLVGRQHTFMQEVAHSIFYYNQGQKGDPITIII
jgi:hypothetical protein